MKNEIKFKEYMTMLCELHDRQLSKIMKDLYWKVLAPFTDERCEAAFKEVIYTSKFFPKPADFLEILKDKKEDRASRAWIKVVNAIRRVGNYQSVKFDDPVIHSVFKFWGGWVVTAAWKEDELKWKQKEFERLYSIMASGGKHPEYLPGFCEIQNGAAGYETSVEIIKIGFDEREQRKITAG